MTLLTMIETNTLPDIETNNETTAVGERFLPNFEAFVEKKHRLAVADMLCREWRLGRLASNDDFLQRIVSRLKPYAPTEKPTQFLVLMEPCWN